MCSAKWKSREGEASSLRDNPAQVFTSEGVLLNLLIYFQISNSEVNAGIHDGLIRRFAWVQFPSSQPILTINKWFVAQWIVHLPSKQGACRFESYQTNQNFNQPITNNKNMTNRNRLGLNFIPASAGDDIGLLTNLVQTEKIGVKMLLQNVTEIPVSYTHLTLPTILRV